MLAAATILSPFLEGGRASNPRYIRSVELESNQPHPLSGFQFFGPPTPQVEKRVTMLEIMTDPDQGLEVGIGYHPHT